MSLLRLRFHQIFESPYQKFRFHLKRESEVNTEKKINNVLRTYFNTKQEVIIKLNKLLVLHNPCMLKEACNLKRCNLSFLKNT